MPVRSLELLDLPTLYHYRGDVVALDTARLLTRGNPLGAIGFLAHFNPSRHIYAAINNESDARMLGGVIHTRGEMIARLLYLAPVEDFGNPAMPSLVEHLAAEAGKWGVHHVVAEVDERSAAFRALHQGGFSVYAWQRIWDISALVAPEHFPGQWAQVKDIELPAIQSLYHQIVPALLHPIEQPPKQASGLTCCSEERRAYVALAAGPCGILVTPMIHPEVGEAIDRLSTLVNYLPDRRGRPVYMCVRSYQAWLEPMLEDLGAKASERQAVMVKHLVLTVKDEQSVSAVQPSVVGIQPSRLSLARTRPRRNRRQIKRVTGVFLG